MASSLVFSSLVAAGLLVLINALYVAAEFGAVAVRKSRIAELAGDGHRLARLLLPHIDTRAALDRYIAACQIGITSSSLLLGALGQAAMTPQVAEGLVGLLGLDPEDAQSVATFGVLAALTIAQMIVGELLPKSLALQSPDLAALYTVAPLGFSLRLFRPLIWSLNGSGLLLLRLLGFKPAEHRQPHSSDEIRLLIAESARRGAMDPDETRRLQKALQLGSRRASEVMTPRERIVAVAVDASAEQLLHVATEAPYTRLPVFRGTLDHVIGVVHTRDIVRRHLEVGSRVTLSDILRPALHVVESTRADRLIVLLREHRSRVAMVTDAQRRVVGLVSVGDLMTEVFGKTADELDSRRAPPARKP